MKKSKVQSPNASLLENKEWLMAQYFDSNKSILDISLMIPCAKLTVARRFKKFGIESKPKHIYYSNPIYPNRKGENSPTWKGGIPDCLDCGIKLKSRVSTRCKKCHGITKRTIKQESKSDLIRHSAEYKDWRNMVFIRDGYKCQICGVNNNNLKAHHLDGFSVSSEKRFDIANGVTLCNEHHIAFHSTYGYGKNTKEQFDEYSSTTEVTY
jgi:5-methylcytosine-specific restriction endonuclease McrA